MRWKPEYAVGIARLDEQHQMIFQMAGDLGLAVSEGRGGRVYSAMLNALEVYCRTHFRFEEGCMAKHKCPVAAENEAAHKGFTEVLTGYRQRFRDHGYRIDDAEMLVNLVENWLLSHICGVDIHLKRCVTG